MYHRISKLFKSYDVGPDALWYAPSEDPWRKRRKRRSPTVVSDAVDEPESDVDEPESDVDEPE